MKSLLGAWWGCREGNNVQSHGDMKFWGGRAKEVMWK